VALVTEAAGGGRVDCAVAYGESVKWPVSSTVWASIFGEIHWYLLVFLSV
jgi:hypothetical protein